MVRRVRTKVRMDFSTTGLSRREVKALFESQQD
jgi:hypothetical protein